MSMSNDTFRTLKDRRKSRVSRAEKNPSILRFGSLSVKVGGEEAGVGVGVMGQ